MRPRRRHGRAIRPSTVVLAAMAVACPRSVPGQDKPVRDSKLAPADAGNPKPEPGAKEPKREPALLGYCPAAYLLLGKAVKGDPDYTSTYADELYQLSSAEAGKLFDADPEKFLPQFAGLCTTALGGSYGNRLPSDPKVFDIRNGKVYLFSSPRAKRAYDKSPEWFIARAGPLFAQPALDGYCPVSYQQHNQALKGQPDARHLYRSRFYHFVSDAAKAAFAKEPQRYLPQYDGYCTEGVSRNKRYPADPTQFVVRKNKTYLFFDADAKAKFIARPEEIVHKADANWIQMKNKKPTG